MSIPELKPNGSHYWVHGAYQRNKRLYNVCKKCLETQRMKQKGARERKQNNGEN